MRVISGTARGTKLLAVPGESSRPILDRVKTALFDYLRPTLAGRRALDLFAGTGSIGIEALSQGADACTFLDINKNAVATIHKNLKLTHLDEKAQVFLKDAFAYIRTCKQEFDLIFIAPPQYQCLWLQGMQSLAERPHILSSSGIIVVQIDPSEYEELHLSEFEETEQRRYGNTLLVYFRPRLKNRS